MLHEIFRVVSRFPRYFSCSIAESRFPLGQCIGGFLGKNHKLVGNIVSGPVSLYACRNLRGQNQSILLYMSVTKLLVSFLVAANLDNLRLSGVNFKVYWNHRSITSRWTKHIRLLLGQNPLPWCVKCACASDR